MSGGARAVVAWMEMWLHKDIKAWHTCAHTHVPVHGARRLCAHMQMRAVRRHTHRHAQRHTHTHTDSILDLRSLSSQGWRLNQDIERAQWRRGDGLTALSLPPLHPSILQREPAIPAICYLHTAPPLSTLPPPTPSKSWWGIGECKRRAPW